jgi:Holliday junction resolvase RusA-like endonuclease
MSDNRTPFFHLTVEGAPVAKGRPRMTRSGRVYTPAKTRTYEDGIRLQTVIEMAGRSATEQPVIVHVAAIFEPPPSWSPAKRQAATGGNAHHSTKPDLDNLLKVLDGICFENGAIRDDKQIIELCAFKTYGPHARLMIDVFEVDSGVDRFSNRWRAWESAEVAISPI